MGKIKQDKIKEQQANMQSDAIELDNWVPSSEGITMSGTVDTLDPGMGVSYSFGDIDYETADMFEENLRKKYPDKERPYKAFLYPTSMIVVLVLYTSFLLLTLITAPIPSLLGVGLTATCLLYTSPSPRDLSTSRMPSSA